jgi:hypothetical protein
VRGARRLPSGRRSTAGNALATLAPEVEVDAAAADEDALAADGLGDAGGHAAGVGQEA